MITIPVEHKAIMPLSITQQELAATTLVLKQVWSNDGIDTVAKKLANQPIKQLFLVGSGDSWAIAHLACGDMERLLALPCRAYQAYEFIQNVEGLVTADCVVIIISASGRPSPVMDALTMTLNLTPLVIVVTNQSGAAFSSLGEYCLSTGALKRGIPTQSTSATLLILLLLATKMACYRNNITQGKCDGILQGLLQSIEKLTLVMAKNRSYWQQQNRELFFTKQVVFLASGSCAAMALLASNLLACGPQLSANDFLLEEYHHSLRLFQADERHYYLIFAPCIGGDKLIFDTASRLSFMGATVLLLSQEEHFLQKDGTTSIAPVVINYRVNLYHLTLMQELTLQLGIDFLHRGGVRAPFDKWTEYERSRCCRNW